MHINIVCDMIDLSFVGIYYKLIKESKLIKKNGLIKKKQANSIK